MTYTGKVITMNTFVFSKPQKTKNDLNQWLQHFLGRGIYAFIHQQEDGQFILVREGMEADTSMECVPTEGPCKHCGKPPPHRINRYKFCSDECMDAEFRGRGGRLSDKETKC